MTTSDLYRLHRPFVRRTLRRLGVGADRLDDAEQDVFVVLLRRLDDLEMDRGVRGWLRGVSRRVAWAHRQRARRGAPPVEVPVAPRQESHVALERVLRDLDDVRFEVLLLSEVEGRTAREIAARLDLPLSTVQWRLRSARQILRGEPRRRTRASAWIPFLGRHALASPALAPALTGLALVAVPTIPGVLAPPAGGEVASVHAASVRIVPWQSTPTPTPPFEETAMPLTTLTFSALLVAAPPADRSAAETAEVSDQDADAAAHAGRQGTTDFYIFHGDDVDGDVWKPSGENIRGPLTQRHESLLELRGHFNAELIRLSFEL